MFDANDAAHENQVNNHVRTATSSPETLMEIIAAVNDSFSDELGKLLKKENLSLLQYQVMRVIQRNGHEGFPSLAIKSEIPHRVMDVTRVVDRLESAGYVVRKRSPQDRRVVLVCLTKAGRDALDRLTPSHESLAAKFTDKLTGLERVDLEHLLGRLK